MCGICGVVRKQADAPVDESCLLRMNEAMSHRGPDDSGIHLAGNGRIGLGNCRLSIIDLSAAGHMPMSNEDGSIWLTYNGEVFNFLDLRPELGKKGHRFRSNTDTEVLIHLYEERGLDFLNAMNGMFALALWDASEERLILARDPFGIKPLYYMPLSGGGIAFASEVKSFIAAGLLEPRIDSEALHDYLNFLWVPSPKTMFEGVFKLPPGHMLIWRDGKYVMKEYWSGVPPREQRRRREGDLIEELREQLLAAVKRHLVSDVPLGFFLSGGIDSSAILALATQLATRSMKAYTISFRSEDAKLEQSDEDWKYAKIVAERFGAEHHQILLWPSIVDLLPKIIWHLDEPVADPAAITSYLICKAAREEATVLLSGQGGDEVFGGYRVHLADRLSRPLNLLPRAAVRSGLVPVLDLLPHMRESIPGVQPGKLMAYHRYLRKLFLGAHYSRDLRYVYHRSYYPPGEQERLYTRDFAGRVAAFDPYETHLRYLRETEGASFVDRMLYLDQKTFLPELNLTYSDKTSMAASVEVRVPLLDQQLATFMRGVPANAKIRGMKQKYLFKKAMEGILPHEVIWRGKAGFGAPIRNWLHGDLKSMIDDLLSEQSLRQRGIFEPATIARMRQADRSGAADHSYRLWALITLELWMRIFVDRRDIAGNVFRYETIPA
jgi:asparagine synthase (glutamine-hydrolysing)